MDGLEFHQRIADHAKIEWAGCREGETPADDRVLVHNGKMMSIPVSEVLGRDWQNLEAVILGRDPWVLEQQTRIVGYWSSVRNWNRGAVAQLADRQKGLYSVPEAC